MRDGAAPAALVVSGLGKSFGARRVFHDVSLDATPGSVVAVLGPSGSGKTTLFRCIAGLDSADAGRVFVGGQDPGLLPSPARKRLLRQVGLVSQQFNLVRRLSAIENVLIGRLDRIPLWRVLLRRFSRADREAALHHLDSVGLADHAWQRADRLSGGQQQRVAIARILMQECPVVLADEPVSSLDPETAETILALLRGLATTRGIAILCSLHQPAYAERFADRILRFRDGTVSAAPLE